MNEPLQELACLYVLDQLDARERAEFEARLLREPELAAFVRDLEATVSSTIRGLPQREPSPDVLARVEAHLGGAPIASSSWPQSGRSRGTVDWVSVARWGLAAVIALSLTTIAVQSLRRSPAAPMIVFVGLDSNRNTFAELPLRPGAKDPDARFIQLAALAEKYWEKPGDLPVRSKFPGGDSRGYALFDPSSLQGFIAVEQLPALAESQRYHLWILDPDSGRIRDAGVLPMAGTNSGLYSFMLGPSDEPQPERPHLFITVEEADAAPAPAQPRGKVVLGDDRI